MTLIFNGDENEVQFIPNANSLVTTILLSLKLYCIMDDFIESTSSDYNLDANTTENIDFFEPNTDLPYSLFLDSAVGMKLTNYNMI